MAIIKDKQVVDDTWTQLGDDDAVPPSGDVIVSLARWLRGETALQSRSGKVGVRLTSSDLAEDLRDHLEGLSLVAVEFPKFADGRGYTQARVLRERLGYRGELRAVGDVLRDQLFYMWRCGFDAFALKPGKDVQGALDAFDDFSVKYQPAADEPLPLFRRL